MDVELVPPLFADEKKCLEKEGRIYSGLTTAERVAWSRDLECCVEALAGDRVLFSRDGEPDLGRLWRDPLGKKKS